MTDNPSVNRCLKDKAMDRIDHALGRPVDPMRPSYRNHFVTAAVAGFEPPFWEQASTFLNEQKCYLVTKAGRAALADYLRQSGSKHRLFHITFSGVEMGIAAETPAKARYQAWLRVNDCCPDLTFVNFSRQATVRMGARPSEAA